MPAAALCLVPAGALLASFAVPQAGRYDFVLADNHSFVREAAVQRALEGAADNELDEVSKLVSVRPIATLPSARGAWCRQLELLYREGPRGLLLACRGTDGVWLIPAADPKNQAYEVALGQTPDAALLSSVKGLVGRPVTADRAKRVREGHWKEKP
jgi:hypothetical protein